jgi:hypothetical protein
MWRPSKLKTARLPALIATLFLLHGAVASGGASAESLLVASFRFLGAVQSIEFRAERDIILPTVPRGSHIKLPANFTGRLHDSYEFHANGDLFRVDVFSGDGSPLRSWSFDGRKYQGFGERELTYAESRRRLNSAPQVPFPDPITSMYTWLFPINAVKSWDTLRRHENLDEAVAHAKLVREKGEGAKRHATVEIERPATTGAATVDSIEFDTEWGMAPGAWSTFSLPTRTLLASVVVRRWSEIDAGDAGKFKLPVEVAINSSSASGTLKIVDGSLRLNPMIDEDMFSLSRSRAKHIVIEPNERRERKYEPPSSLVRIGFLSAEVAAIIVAAVWLAIWLRRRFALRRDRS